MNSFLIFSSAIVIALSTLSTAKAAGCTSDLSKGTVVVLSGGAFDGINPQEVLQQMEIFIQSLNQSTLVKQCSNNKGLRTRLLPGQTTFRNHQSEWSKLCAEIAKQNFSPIVIAGHSNGGASSLNLARCLEEKNIQVDLLITADSVANGGDNGDAYEVPSNVQYNINTYLVPTAATFLIPFPFGQANSRESDNSLQGVFNLGLHYNLPAAIAHRNAFYEFAGGDSKPNSLLKLTLVALSGATESQMTDQLIEVGSLISGTSKIRVDIETQGLKKSIK